jgi:hypothetical protein
MTGRVSGTSLRCMKVRSHRFALPWSSATRCVMSWVGTFAALSVALFVGSPRACVAQAETHASEPWLRIEAAGDPCVDADDLRREIEQLLDAKRPSRVVARAWASGVGWNIELRHATGQTALRAFPVLPDACAERVRALALVTALAIEHAVDVPPVAADEAPPREESALTWSLGLHAGASLGELPGPAPVLGAYARIERGMWVPVELLASADVRPSSRASLAGVPLVTRQLTLGLGSCVGGTPSAWRIDGCVGVELGAVLGSAASLPRATRATAGSGALTLALATRWSPRTHLGVTARLEGFVRVWVPAFRVLDAEGEPFAERRLPLVGGRLFLGLSWLSR